MDSPPVISVICPVYNTLPYLDRCAVSVLRQSFVNFEFILVNDGSTDGSGERCRRYQEEDRRVVYTDTGGGGISNARNAGLEKARGAYIAWIDSDDWADPRWLETMHSLAESYGADMAVTRRRIVSGFKPEAAPSETAGPEEITLLDTEQALGDLVEDLHISSTLMNKLFKRSLYDGLRFPSGRVFEDTALMHVLLSRCGRVVVSNRKTYNYFKRLGSITHRHSIVNEYHRYLAHRDRLEFFKETGRGALFLKEAPIAISYSLMLEEMALLHRKTAEEARITGEVSAWRRGLLAAEPGIPLDTGIKRGIAALEKGALSRFTLFLRAEFLRRLSYGILSRLPPLPVVFLRTVKRALCRT